MSPLNSQRRKWKIENSVWITFSIFYCLFSSLAVSAAQAAPQLDQYGGRADIACTGGAKPQFYTEKINSR